EEWLIGARKRLEAARAGSAAAGEAQSNDAEAGV
ncbi:MAG: exodeoxyribonuclease VII small subunit, partial [Leucobacter sp.]|nr:exodeoxyribonuclease VII small subunit [Leucobacter sp.]